MADSNSFVRGYLDVQGDWFVFNHGKYTVVVMATEHHRQMGVYLQPRHKIYCSKSDKNRKGVSLPVAEVREIVGFAEESERLKEEALQKSRQLRTKLGF